MILQGMTRIQNEDGSYGGYQYSVEHDGLTALVVGCPREHSSKTVHERVAYSVMRAELQNKREQDHECAKEIMAGIEAEKGKELREEFTEEEDLGVIESAPTIKNKKHEIHAYMKARGIKYGANDNKKKLLRLIEEFHANEERKE